MLEVSTVYEAAFSTVTPGGVEARPFGRSVKDLDELVGKLEKRGVHFQSLTDAIDTSTPAGHFFFHMMASLAQMERELLIERTKAGLVRLKLKDVLVAENSR